MIEQHEATIKQPLKPEWRNSDPRHDFIDLKRVSIVILRPAASGKSSWEAGIDQAEMKHGWNVITSFDTHPYVGEDEKWDTAWWWVRAPETTK
jgi:hypothetical protein